MSGTELFNFDGVHQMLNMIEVCSLLAASEQSGVWILGSFLILLFGAIVGLYTWMESKMESMEKKFVSREVCQQIHLKTENMIKGVQESARHCARQLDRLVDHLIDNKDKKT